MRRLFLGAALSTALLFTACGDGSVPVRSLTARQALTSNSEVTEFEAPAVRQDLFRDVAKLSVQQAGRETTEPVLFPILRDNRMYAAPGLDAKADLLQMPDAGHPLQLQFNGREAWPEDRRDSLGGLSEREAAELMARTLLAMWELPVDGPVLVDRASGAPYAAAWVDGILRINPAFLYMAASVGPGSASVQTP